MWISKKRLEELAQRSLEQQDQLRRGYLLRIENLEAEIKYQDRLNAQYRAQIEDLRALVFPKVVTEVPAEARELDAVISASEKPPEMSEEDRTKILEGMREQDLLLSGNYDTELLQ